MKQNILLASLALIALAGCSVDTNPDVPMVEREKEPVVFEGSGNLCYVGDSEEDVEIENSTYAWSAKDDLISIVANIDLNEYKNRGAYEIGHFTLPMSTIAEFLGGVSPADLDESTFYAVTPGGEQTEFTSYKPGMWITNNGEPCSWSDGSAFWQWYVWGGKGETYDWDYNNHQSMFVLGGHPSNTVNNMPGKSLTTEARIVAGGQTFRLVITYNFSELEKSKEGEGALKMFEYDDDYNVVGEYEVNSKYYYKITESSIRLDFNIDSEQYSEIGDWTIGHLTLPVETIKEMLGIDVTTLDESTFYPIDAFGEALDDFTSYKPGMWIDAAGAPADWSAGCAYWQWYVWGGKTDKNGAVIEYDDDYNQYPGLFVVGSNPGNLTKITFDEPFSSYAMMEANGKKCDITVNFTFSEKVLPEQGEAQDIPMYAGNNELPYSAGVTGNHTWAWYFTDESLHLDILAFTPDIVTEGAWEFLDVTVNPDVMAEAGVDMDRLTDITYFYPLAADGTPLDTWSSYEPGMWVDANGDTSNWADGCMYWQYQFGDNKYDGHYTEGLFVIGTNPDNAAASTDKMVTSKAVLGERVLYVNVYFLPDWPTHVQGSIGAHTYEWEMTETAFNIKAQCSLSHLDESWNWFGFPLNINYVNNCYGIDLAEISQDIEQVYPVAADGTKYDSWSSYAPGMWFDADGNKADWSSGWSFWQYYTHTTYDYDIPNLVLLGNNCNPDIFTVGQTVTSKAKIGDVDWNWTIEIIE